MIVQAGDWLIESDGQYVIVSHKVKPGEIHIKIEDEAYITDIVSDNGEVIGGGWASFVELDDME